jgi:hypothetical protein
MQHTKCNMQHAVRIPYNTTYVMQHTTCETQRTQCNAHTKQRARRQFGQYRRTCDRAALHQQRAACHEHHTTRLHTAPLTHPSTTQPHSPSIRLAFPPCAPLLRAQISPQTRTPRCHFRPGIGRHHESPVQQHAACNGKNWYVAL